MLEQIRRPLALEKWIENLFRPTVVASMMASIVISAVALVHRVDPRWGGAYLVVFVFLVSWEAIQSERVLKHSAPGQFNRARFRFTEAVIILLLLKLAGYTELGAAQLLTDIVRWFRNLSTFFDGGYIMAAVLIMLLWQLSMFIAQDLYVIEVHPSELRPSSTSAKFYLWLTQPRTSLNRTAALERIMVSFFWGGLILIICTGMARYDIPYLFPDRPPPVSALVLNVMAYFLLGLVLISQAYYSVLRARWQLEEIEIASHIGSHWAILTAAFLLLVIVIALLLPTGYAVGLPQAIALAAHLVSTGMMFVVLFLLSILIFIINAIAALLLGRATPVFDPPSVGPMATPPPGAGRGPGLPIWAMLRDVLVWLLLLGMVAYSLYHFLGDRRQLLKGLFAGGILGRLSRLLARLLGGTRQAARRAGRLAQEQLRRLLRAGARQRPWRYLSLSSLTPRQLILYFYLSIMRRAEERDIVRQPWQTPYEYGARLRDALPEQEFEVTELTEAFVVARYSAHPVTSEEANLAKRTWRRVRSALRRWRLSR
jgi:Na+-transporting methylmalonyl-CoA/oxaloacetate decarboxylase gamma subunit